ncbi:MAG: hypothetical protein DWG76_02110 [Chloroflexi bacterium]|nr:hypothetical protein [Chloroflexota bacterium]
MSTLAIFTAPKPFTDAHINTIQRNAIHSWAALGDQVEVWLQGDEPGIAKAAKELGVQHIKDVARNAQGTPLVSAMLAAARASSEAPVLAVVNADIILLPETLPVLEQVRGQAEQFVLMGQRYDLQVKDSLDFNGNWVGQLQAEIQRAGLLHPQGGSDYFIFPRHLYNRVPDFAIGRAGWDNWMIHEAVTQPWLAVDATSALPIIHQTHDYAHLPQGRAHYRVAETDENTRLAGGMRHIYTLLDVNLELRAGKMRAKRPNLARSVRRVERWLQPDERAGTGWRWALLRRLRRLRRHLLRVEES